MPIAKNVPLFASVLAGVYLAIASSAGLHKKLHVDLAEILTEG